MIPIVFEGDLAHTDVCHLKEKDNIYIAGHLSGDKLPLNLTRNHYDFQSIWVQMLAMQVLAFDYSCLLKSIIGQFDSMERFCWADTDTERRKQGRDITQR